MPDVQVERHTIRISTHSEMEALGSELADLVRPGDFVLLNGALGAGKSVLARSLALALGATDWQGSPTYTLVNEYSGKPPIFHVDLYRLSAPDLADLGLDDLGDPLAITLVEWADRGGESLRRLCGPRTWEIEIDYVGMTERDVRIAMSTTE